MKTCKITKITSASYEIVDDTVTEEIMLSIDINKKELVTLLCTNHNLKELVTGYLFSSGIIINISEIKNIEIFNLFCEKWCAHVELVNKSIKQLKFKKVLNTGCGKGSVIFNEKAVSNFYGIIKSDIQIKSSLITDLMKKFQESSKIFLQTGGVHSSAMVHNGKIVSFMEDLGRHNAIDKVIGYFLMKHSHVSDFSDKIILTSGRITSEILQKISRCKIPIIISRSAPTDKAVEICIKKNITLVGFARGNRMNVYSGIQRINLTGCRKKQFITES